MTDFNSYMGNIDTDFFRELCLRNGELRYYKRNEFILREGEVGSFFGFIVSGVIKYTCINQTENKTYNVGFSFANEFISDYPNCLYDIKSELKNRSKSCSERGWGKMHTRKPASSSTRDTIAVPKLGWST